MTCWYVNGVPADENVCAHELHPDFRPTQLTEQMAAEEASTFDN